MERPQEQSHQPGNDRKGYPLAKLKLWAESVTERFYRLGSDGHFGNPRPRRFATCFVADSRLPARQPMRSPEVTRGPIQWGCRAAPFVGR